MKLNKKVKLVLHHELDESIEVSQKFSWFFLMGKLFKLGLKLIFDFFYGVGLTLISIIRLPRLIWQSPKQLAVARSNKTRQLNPYNTGLIFVLLLVLTLAPIFAFQLASQGHDLSGKVLGISDGALSSLNQASQAIEAQDYQKAQADFGTALNQLNLAQKELDSSGLLLQGIIKTLPQQYDAVEMLKAAQLLTRAAQNSSQVMLTTNSIKITPQGLTTQTATDFDTTFKDLSSKLKAIADDLSQANKTLQAFNVAIVPEQYVVQYIALKELVADLHQQTQSLPLLSDALEQLLLGKKRFLVVMQNNNELRATGGFIGTIGQGILDNGQIQHLDIRSVYDLDGQLLEWIKPPQPMSVINNRLYLRDSNWLVDFPTSAQNLSILYEKEGGETPDLVMALTPDFFIDLLTQTGPIDLPSYDVTITANNFVEQIQTSTSVAYDKSLNQPKQLLADLYPALMQRINFDSQQSLFSFIALLQNHLGQKNIILYSRDPNLQSKLQQLNWAGEVKSTDRDYLQVVSTNLSGSKTDRVLERNLFLTTEIRANGSVKNKLRYQVSNPLPSNPALENQSLVRFLIPSQSQLLAAYGFDHVELPPLEYENYEQLSWVADWDNNLKYDELTQVYQGSESGYNLVAGWVNVPGGSSKEVIIEYELPFSLKNTDRYSMLWQKQPGMHNLSIEHEISWAQPWQVTWSKLAGQTLSEQQSEYKYRVNLTLDTLVGLVMEKH